MIYAPIGQPSLDRHGIQRLPRCTGQIPHLVTERFDEFSVQKSEHGAPYGPSKEALESATVIWAKDLVGTSVTVNALAPGGPANTRMIPKSEVGDRSTLIQPEVMMAPIVWLMSARSDGVSGRRIFAKEGMRTALSARPPRRSAFQRDGEKPFRDVLRPKCPAELTVRRYSLLGIMRTPLRSSPRRGNTAVLRTGGLLGNDDFIARSRDATGFRHHFRNKSRACASLRPEILDRLVM